MQLKLIIYLSMLIWGTSIYAKSYYIIKIEEDKAYVDITKSETISSKSLNIFSKPETVIHPISGKEIEISKNLGVITLIEVKDGYSVASIPANLKDKVEIGQRVEFSSGEGMDTGALAFGEEVIEEMGKNRNSLFLTGGLNYISSKDNLYGGELNYKYNFLLTYLYSILLGMGIDYGKFEEDNKMKNPKLLYAKAAFEFKMSTYFSLIMGGRVGLKEEGIGYGFDGGFRIGKPYRTNMVFSGGYIQDFGVYGLFQLNGKIGIHWLNATLQLDNYPAALSQPTFRVRFGGILTMSDTLNFAGGLILSGRDTNTIGWGFDLGIEKKF